MIRNFNHGGGATVLSIPVGDPTAENLNPRPPQDKADGRVEGVGPQVAVRPIRWKEDTKSRFSAEGCIRLEAGETEITFIIMFFE